MVFSLFSTVCCFTDVINGQCFTVLINKYNMKVGSKRSSLQQGKHQNNLKDMLQYYNEKSYHKTPSLPFEPIYQYEEINTQEVILPKTSRDSLILTFPRNSSHIPHRHHDKPQNADPDAYSEQRKNRLSYSRQNFTEMNARLRKIRTSQMHRTSQRNREVRENQVEGGFESGELLTAREALVKSNEFISRKMLLSPYGQRAVNLFLQDGGSSHQRPATTLAGEAKTRIRSKGFPTRNPHVIYQFQSHLKAKRIDDNPKVLGNIIRKKYTQVGKDELYSYINGLIKRREK